jgi:hypothetical protein
MAREWFIRHSGKECGPYSGQALKLLAESGRLTPDSLVKRGEHGHWAWARQLQGLAFPVKERAIGSEAGVVKSEQPAPVPRPPTPQPLAPTAQAATQSRQISSEPNREVRPLAFSVVGIVVVSGFMLGLVIMLSGGSSNSTHYSTSPYQYNDTTDRSLKPLPSLDRFTDAEKEHIISEAKKFDAAVRSLERRR